MSRAGYRALLDGGVHIFEWNGVMVHAKTAVADGKWARVGSTVYRGRRWAGGHRHRGGQRGATRHNFRSRQTYFE